MSLTTGLKPFSPRSPGDLNLEDVVKFSRAGGKLSQGTVKFVGHLPGRSDAYLGVELDKEGEGCLSMWKKTSLKLRSLSGLFHNLKNVYSYLCSIMSYTCNFFC